MIGAPLVLDLLTWRRDGSHDDPLDYAPLDKDEWRAWAARQYRNAVTHSQAVPLPNKDTPHFPSAWSLNRRHRELAGKRVRLLVGALFHRALDLGWRDVAARWHSRYWRMTDVVDSNEDLQTAARELRVLEDIERVPGLFT